MLIFKSLTIYKDCQYKKNLEVGTYTFNDCSIEDFYGRNVTLHAIVGKNGSGKSSLLDMVFRILNNVGAIMLKNEEINISSPIKFVRHIFVDLNYQKSNHIGDVLHNATLSLRDTALWLTYDGVVYWLSDNSLCEMFPVENEYLEGLKKKYGKNKVLDYSDMANNDYKEQIASMLFFTIATNYSMLGFQSVDYENEESLAYEKGYLELENGDYIELEDGEKIEMSQWTPKKNWINGIFHKNDGYLSPIVLNPYRDMGLINVAAESSLTMNRLSTLFLYARSKQQPVIEDYFLDNIEYEVKSDFYLKFKPVISRKDKKTNLLANGGDLFLFREAALTKHSRSWTILKELNFPIDNNMSDIELYAHMYLAYKVMHIGETYPHYQKFREYCNINSIFLKGVHSITPYRELVREILSHNTHIEQKIYQTITFIEKIKNAKQTIEGFTSEWLHEKFTLDEYCEKLGLQINFDMLESYIFLLPPSIFKQKIYLKKSQENGIWNHGILFSHLSSGQKQMLYQLSSIVYHMLNLKTIPNNEIHYNQINIVLDEIEVCFHPEYQRKFISRLIGILINVLRLNETFGIHIWLTTHSPFILSDIPQELITYMEDGHQLTKDEMYESKILSPLAANISELLHQSFFLRNGFIGEFVRNKIISLVDYLQNSNDENDGNYWTEKKILRFIEMIDEPFISMQLKRLYEFHKKNKR